MPTLKVDTSNFQKEVLNSAEPVVVDFWAPWCGPCKMIAPSLDEISTELAGKVKLVKLNIDENPELTAGMASARSPCLQCSRQGEVADTMVGAAPKTALISWILNAIGLSHLDLELQNTSARFGRALFLPWNNGGRE
ncbi:thioredoxin [Sinorhizobium medicae]|uniref:thioredoxin n=1 Tax=Sinorhizobium medicae TaxID=110321 RepID=UPI00396A3B14